MLTDIQKLIVTTTDTIHQAIVCINGNQKGIALIVDAKGFLVSTITDGDIRRATLEGLRLDASVASLMRTKVDQSPPVTAPPDSSNDELLELMRRHSVQQVPLVDNSGEIVGLKTVADLLPSKASTMQAVIMAGGYGTRLHPLTEELPKPMLPLGGRPLLQYTLDKLKQAEIKRVHISTHYLSEKIMEHFGDGKSEGLDIQYVDEDHPLGTAGALGLIAKTDEPLLVINGDIVTELDFRAMLSFHKDHEADMTVAVRQYDIQIPYGVLKSSGPYVKGVEEKPVMTYMVNAGIYLLSPVVYGFVPRGGGFDMPDLISLLVERGRTVTNFPVLEYWLDIGQHDDYKKAQEDIEKGVLNT